MKEMKKKTEDKRKNEEYHKLAWRYERVRKEPEKWRNEGKWKKSKQKSDRMERSRKIKGRRNTKE